MKTRAKRVAVAVLVAGVVSLFGSGIEPMGDGGQCAEESAQPGVQPAVLLAKTLIPKRIKLIIQFSPSAVA